MDDVHSTDYFSQKNCALQYAAMIDKVPNKRNKRASEDGGKPKQSLGLFFKTTGISTQHHLLSFWLKFFV